MGCVCNLDTGVKCMLHVDLDGYILARALNGQDISVNYMEGGKEKTAMFFSEHAANDFIEHIGNRFVECNFTPRTKEGEDS